MDSNSVLLVPVPALFSFQECIWFLNRNYDDCLHVIEGDVIFKAIEIEGNAILFGVKESGNFLEVEIIMGEAGRKERDYLTAYVREWFDMERNVQPFYDLLIKDQRLAYMADEYKGLRLIGISNLFEAICWCIIGQQINLSFAYKVKRRLVERYGSQIACHGKSYYIFPTAEVLASASVEDLKAMQFSEKKAQYTLGIARAFHEGSLDKDKIASLPDLVSRKKALTDFKGIGVWTANYALMKSLKEPECIPHGDIGLLNALSHHNIISDRKEQPKIDALFSTFAGWQSYLVFYLWRSLAVKELI